MNNLFQDIINQGNIATFIDDIIVATDTKEGHDKLVEEVLKKLEENCYEWAPKKENIFYTFINLMENLQKYNARKI